VVIAPEITDNALEQFKNRQTRLFTLPLPPRRRAPATLPSFALQYRPVLGGLLAQTPDAVPIEDIRFTVVSQRQPTEQQLHELRFAWRVVKHVRSNAAVFTRDNTVYGVGAGQQSRVDAVAAARRVAARSATDRGLDPERPAEGCVMATDGFFPVPDAVIEAIEAGATVIAHPGGSKQDEASLAAADERGAVMVTTGIRHFRH
jgi:phosphoribosylaminoimidazolecarboxamide formyltransferase/IMP cyclohydrolase